MVSNNEELDQTATWALALVSLIFISISLSLEKIIHKMGMCLVKRNKITLLQALEKLKTELMILGFLSLLLNIGESWIVHICVAANMANIMLPCPNRDARRRRHLAQNITHQCKEGSKPLISVHGLHQLHILIFILAVLHVVCSAATVFFGKLKIRKWKAWEAEICSHGYQSANCMTELVQHRATFFAKTPLFYTICFFRQFYGSVREAEYLSLRNEFIAVHLSRENTYNFQEHIKKSLEDDFKVVVGISPLLWGFFVVSLLSNVDGWDAMLWTSLITLVIIFVVNTKLEAILSDMSVDITERHGLMQSNPKKYFWFGKPRLVLDLIHFALFESAFQITYYIWLWSSFGRIACLSVGITPSLFKIVLGFGMIFICSYVSLPLYALVTQITGTRKRSTSDELGVSNMGSMHGSSTNHSSRFIDGRPASMALMTYIWTTRRGMRDEECQYEPRDEEFVDEMQADDDVEGSYDTHTPISRSIIRAKSI